MKLPWKNDDAVSDDRSTSADTAASGSGTPATAATQTGTTPGKGRPTPTRREAQGRRRGPVTPAPLTRAEARARRKELGKVKLTREERKKRSDERRSTRNDQRERMMDGDERYLMPRDKGPVRRFTRDIVDSRRNLAGLFMPFAVMLIVVLFLPATQGIATLVMLVFTVFLIVDGVILGRLVNKRVLERFPDSVDGGFKLGWYAFSRAMQMRFMRAPRPQVSTGDAV